MDQELVLESARRLDLGAEEGLDARRVEAALGGPRAHRREDAGLLARILDRPTGLLLGCGDRRHEGEAQIDERHERVQVRGEGGARARPLRAEPAGAERGERPIGLMDAEPGIERGDQPGIAPEVALPVAREGAQADGAGDRERVRLGLVGQDGVRGPAGEQLRERAVVVGSHEECVREEPRGEPLQVPARVHPEPEPGAARVEPLVGEHHRPRLRDRAREHARHRALGPERDAAHRQVEAPRGEVARQLRPAEADELEAAPAVVREAARDLDVEPLETTIAREREGRVVAARADPERRRLGPRVEAGRSEEGDRRRAPHSPSTSRIE